MKKYIKVHKYFLLLFFIILLSALLRFVSLGSHPPSLTWDEVAIGYNAYSIGIDGKDEYGKMLPYQYFESFGDFKPPLAIYLDVLPVKFFGLTPFAVRFPSALCGVLSVLMTYFLTKRIFENSSKKEVLALVSAFILAVSPWHIMLSRGMFEANIATFFLIGGVWAYLSAMQGKKWHLFLASIFFVASIYTFNSARIVAPLLVALLSLRYIKTLWENKIYSVAAGVLGLVLFLPILPFLLSDQASLRFHEVNIFTDPTPIITSNQEIVNDSGEMWSKLLHNWRVVYALSFIDHYFDHFNPSYLFITGDENPKFSIQDVGQMYLWDLPFFIIGILFLFRKREGEWWLIPLWLIIGLIPAGTARETPHALRTEAALPTFQILIAYGVVKIMDQVKLIKVKKHYRYAFVMIPIFLLLLNIFYFQFQYWQTYPVRFSREWQYGYEESIHFVNTNKDKYNKFYITEELGRGYIYYLFYMNISPQDFRNTAKIHRDTYGLIDVEGFDKYVFSKTVETLPKEENVLYINTPDKVPSGATVVKSFYLLDGSERLTAYEFI